MYFSNGLTLMCSSCFGSEELAHSLFQTETLEEDNTEKRALFRSKCGFKHAQRKQTLPHICVKKKENIHETAVCCCGHRSNLCLEHNYGFFFCVRLLNLAWPRSRGSELRSLLSVDSAIDTQLPSDLQQNGGCSLGQFSLSTKLQSGWINSEFCQNEVPAQAT